MSENYELSLKNGDKVVTIRSFSDEYANKVKDLDKDVKDLKENAGSLDIEVSDSKPTAETVQNNVLYAYKTPKNVAFDAEGSEVQSIILDENNTVDNNAGLGVIRYTKSILKD